MVRVHTALANVRTAVDGAMVSTLAAAIENQVVVHVITAAHAIVEVEACTSQIKAKILGQRGLCGFGLEPARALLLPEVVQPSVASVGTYPIATAPATCADGKEIVEKQIRIRPWLSAKGPKQ